MPAACDFVNNLSLSCNQGNILLDLHIKEKSSSDLGQKVLKHKIVEKLPLSRWLKELAKEAFFFKYTKKFFFQKVSEKHLTFFQWPYLSVESHWFLAYCPADRLLPHACSSLGEGEVARHLGDWPISLYSHCNAVSKDISIWQAWYGAISSATQGQLTLKKLLSIL